MIEMLEKWVIYQIYGSALPKQSKIKLEIILSYFSLKSYYINYHLSLDAILAYYLAPIFLRFVLPTTKIVIIRGGIH